MNEMNLESISQIVKYAEKQSNPLIKAKLEPFWKSYKDLVMVVKLSSSEPMSDIILPTTRIGLARAIMEARAKDDNEQLAVLTRRYQELDR